MIKQKPIKVIIDDYLDIYYNYKTLYEMFGDEEYKETMGLVIEILNDMKG